MAAADFDWCVDRRELAKSGFLMFDLGQELIANTVCEIANAIGQIRPGRSGRAIEEVVPRGVAELAYPSLSAIYGRNALPWHVDTAHWATPAHYLILACIHEGTNSPSTQLLDWRDIQLTPEERETAKTAPFRVRNGRESFYSTILTPGTPFPRHDPGCMEALGDDAAALQARLSLGTSGDPSIVVNWRSGRVIVFDNWRYLHRRLDASNSIGRMLLRMYVGEAVSHTHHGTCE